MKLSAATPDAQVQFIDARDLAEWIMRMAEQKNAGIYNATGPATRLTFQHFLETCQAATGSDATLTWVSANFLAEHEVSPWKHLPLWLPEEMRGMLQVDIAKATSAGLTFRALSETITDTLVWARTRPDNHMWQAGLKPAREAALLTLWRQGQV